MEAVTILRELWRRRILVALAALASIFAAFAIAYTVTIPPESRKFEVGIATGRILVDTPDSQVVDVSPRGSGTLGIRAGLLANLMTEGEVKAAIARRAGLRPGQLHAGVEIEGELPVVLTQRRRQAQRLPAHDQPGDKHRRPAVADDRYRDSGARTSPGRPSSRTPRLPASTTTSTLRRPARTFPTHAGCR